MTSYTILSCKSLISQPRVDFTISVAAQSLILNTKNKRIGKHREGRTIYLFILLYLIIDQGTCGADELAKLRGSVADEMNDSMQLRRPYHNWTVHGKLIVTYVQPYTLSCIIVL